MATALRQGSRLAKASSACHWNNIRPFSVSQLVNSGHNRWSKIKHDKGKADARKTRLRSALAKELTYASRTYGSNPNHPRIELAIANAKKADFPKASIESALARGQGVSLDGAALESLLVEAVLPPSVPLIIECQTDNKNRTLKDLRVIIKKYGGTAKPTLFCFEKRGRVRLESDGRTVDDIFDEVVEAGAEDVEEEEDGGIVIFTEPSSTTSTAAAVSKSTGLHVRSAELIYQGSSSMEARVESDQEMKALNEFVGAVLQDPGVQNVYANVGKNDSVSMQAWDELESQLSN